MYGIYFYNFFSATHIRVHVEINTLNNLNKNIFTIDNSK